MAALTNQDLLDAASAAITQQRPLLDSIREINLRFLLSVRAALEQPSYCSGPDLGAAAPLFGSLDPEDLDGVSHFPFLLMDLGMSAAESIFSVVKRYGSVQDMSLHPQRAAHLALARTALVAGWYAARTDQLGALLLFGFSQSILPQLASMPLHEIEALAPTCVSPLTLRWRTNPSLWDELLNPRAYTSVDTVRGFVMHAVQLTATTHLK
jgi:hypothetical protein